MCSVYGEIPSYALPAFTTAWTRHKDTTVLGDIRLRDRTTKDVMPTAFQYAFNVLVRFIMYRSALLPQCNLSKPQQVKIRPNNPLRRVHRSAVHRTIQVPLPQCKQVIRGTLRASPRSNSRHKYALTQISKTAPPPLPVPLATVQCLKTHLHRTPSWYG
jgi:hypothetical protein